MPSNIYIYTMKTQTQMHIHFPFYLLFPFPSLYTEDFSIEYSKGHESHMCSVLKLSCNHCSNYPTWDSMLFVWNRKTWLGIRMAWSSLWRSHFSSLDLVGHHHSFSTHCLLLQWPLQVHKRAFKKGVNTSVRGQGRAELTFRKKTNRWDPGNLQGNWES